MVVTRDPEFPHPLTDGRFVLVKVNDTDTFRRTENTKGTEKRTVNPKRTIVPDILRGGKGQTTDCWPTFGNNGDTLLVLWS